MLTILVTFKHVCMYIATYIANIATLYFMKIPA